MYREPSARAKAIGIAQAVADSLGSGLAAAQALPADLASRVTTQAQQAFTDGFTRSALAGTVLAIVAVVALLLPRRATDATDATEPTGRD